MARKHKQMSAPAIFVISMACATVGTALYVYALAVTGRIQTVNLEPPLTAPVVMR